MIYCKYIIKPVRNLYTTTQKLGLNSIILTFYIILNAIHCSTYFYRNYFLLRVMDGRYTWEQLTSNYDLSPCWPIQSIESNRLVLPPSSKTYTVTGLQPYTQYKFQVVCENEIGKAASNSWVTARTLEARKLLFLLIYIFCVETLLTLWKKAFIYFLQ